MTDNKKVFEVEKKKYAVLRPTNKVQQQAQLVYNRAFRLAVKPEDGKPGAIVRAALESVLREQKLWDDSRQKEFEEIGKRLADAERRLAKGGFKLSEARDLALGMRRDRSTLRQLLGARNSLDINTAEAQAENARFNFLVSACAVDNESGKPVWKSEEDYLADTANPVAEHAAQNLGTILYGLDENFESKLPENRWLRGYGFADDKNRLVNKDGHLVDHEGRLINEEGRFVDKDGNFIDIDGNRLNKDGDFEVDFSPFLSDDGEPVPPPLPAAAAK